MNDEPRFLLAGDAHDPLVVVRSRFWNFNAIGLFDGDAACVVDPGIYPDEIEMLREAVRTRARAGAPRTVTHVAVTHSHHDHIRGWQRFPGATVTFPSVAATKSAEVQGRILAAKDKIDERLGVDDPGFTYPRADVAFDDRARFTVGGLDVELRFLPGHSNCTSVVWIPALATLCTADYLVSPGLPYCRWQARDFEAATATMRRWVEEDGVERIVPAHNDLLLGRAAILDALDAERDYFVALRRAVQRGIEEGLDDERCARRAARAMAERRGADVGKRERQDLDNARRVVAEESAVQPG